MIRIKKRQSKQQISYAINKSIDHIKCVNNNKLMKDKDNNDFNNIKTFVFYCEFKKIIGHSNNSHHKWAIIRIN